MSGFLSDDPEELAGYARRLLEDRALASRMGCEARKVVVERFAPDKFKAGLSECIIQARRRWLAHKSSQGRSLPARN